MLWSCFAVYPRWLRPVLAGLGLYGIWFVPGLFAFAYPFKHDPLTKPRRSSSHVFVRLRDVAIHTLGAGLLRNPACVCSPHPGRSPTPQRGKILRQELPGYSEYCLHTLFRLVPLLWWTAMSVLTSSCRCATVQRSDLRSKSVEELCSEVSCSLCCVILQFNHHDPIPWYEDRLKPRRSM